MTAENVREDLRHRAERALLAGATAQSQNYKVANLEHLIHELRVHQAELEMQNEELRRAQLRLSEAHDRYQELYDFAPVGYVVADEEWHITDANSTAAALLGVERAKLLRSRLTRYLTEAECDSFHWYLRKLKAAPQMPPFEGWFRRDGGDLLRGVLKIQHIGSGFRVALLDITGQRSAEDQLFRKNIELAAASQRLSQIAKTIPDVFYALELGTGKPLYLSNGFGQVFGLSEHEALPLTQRWLPFVHEDDVPKVLGAWASVKDGGQVPFDIEYRIIHRDGTHRLIRDRGFVDSVHNQLVGVLHDITPAGHAARAT